MINIIYNITIVKDTSKVISKDILYEVYKYALENIPKDHTNTIISIAGSLTGIVIGFGLSYWNQNRIHHKKVNGIVKVLTEELFDNYKYLTLLKTVKDVDHDRIRSMSQFHMRMHKEAPKYLEDTHFKSYLVQLHELNDEDFREITSIYVNIKRLIEICFAAKVDSKENEVLKEEEEIHILNSLSNLEEYLNICCIQILTFVKRKGFTLDYIRYVDSEIRTYAKEQIRVSDEIKEMVKKRREEKRKKDNK
ncbi:MAG: hypothetical protein PHD97_11870 [Bacteroidales bacterium]|nr:hypothetical protein [Bacteroidales bacterium]